MSDDGFLSARVQSRLLKGMRRYGCPKPRFVGTALAWKFLPSDGSFREFRCQLTQNVLDSLRSGGSVAVIGTSAGLAAESSRLVGSCPPGSDPLQVIL